MFVRQSDALMAIAQSVVVGTSWLRFAKAQPVRFWHSQNKPLIGFALQNNSDAALPMQ
jgi:hypothetical protein